MLSQVTSSRTIARRVLSTVVLCGFVHCAAIASDAPSGSATDSVHTVPANTRRLEVRAAESLLVQFPDWLTRVRSRDSNVIRVTAVRPDCLRVTRVSEGTARLLAVDRHEREYSVELLSEK